ncbi:hypothetical protein [Sinosporangium siamense]|uniref:Uncharacterized protein n=1 Tax=Sinosporangium siamense TaxID=1367973 RepID=A0A919VBK3_9ACTN|nr:hypothetical protein [Sinosporangium siamense]GII97473.1 hypothetical protein Ssi02_77040 [Sinosporangium siamense]
MTDDVEAGLRSVLMRAAEQAPQAPGELSTRLVTVSRRRRRARLSGLAAVAAAVVAVGGVGVTWGVAAQPAPSPLGQATTAASVEATSPVSPVEEIAGPSGDLIEKVWPQAVRTVPKDLPGGEKIRPVEFIDDDTLLVTTWGSFERTNALYAYDLGSAALRKIADVPTPEGTVGFATDFTIGAEHVVWWSQRRTGDIDLWAAPLGGGEAKRVAVHNNGKGVEDDGVGIEPPSVTGDGRIVFSYSMQAGVFTVPLGGGTVEPLAGGEGLYLLRWPWIGSVEVERHAHPDTPSFGELVNMETGEKRTAVVHPGEREVRCGLTVCTGLKSDGKAFYRLRDGSQEKEGGLRMSPGGLAYDRFLIATGRGSAGAMRVFLQDLATGTSADLGIEPDKDGSIGYPAIGAHTGRLYSYEVKDKLVLVDFGKIS